LGGQDARNVFFDASVDFVIIEKGDVLSPKETVCEIFDFAEAHFFSFSIILLIV
tara:strand:- start:162 stop:323 length:162 start_codon:yes stop_codon:yes gene_type:complete